MLKGEPPPSPTGRLTTIELIGNHRVTRFGEVNTNLVSAPRVQAHLKQHKRLALSQNTPMGTRPLTDRYFAAHLESLSWMAPELCFDRPPALQASPKRYCHV